MIAKLLSITQAPDDNGGVFLLRVRCPLCHRTHTHGGGTERSEVASFLGSRVAHCLAGGYFIRDTNNVLGTAP